MKILVLNWEAFTLRYQSYNEKDRWAYRRVHIFNFSIISS